MQDKIIMPYEGTEPQLGHSVVILPGARVIGNVTLGEGTSVWFNSIVRGDESTIKFGKMCNIQDLCMVHSTRGISETIVGDFVTLGHNATVHGAIIGDYCLIGMGAVVLDNAKLGEFVLIGAGSVVTPGTEIPPYTLAVGSPCKPRRELRPDEVELIKSTALLYNQKAMNYAESGMAFIKK